MLHGWLNSALALCAYQPLLGSRLHSSQGGVPTDVQQPKTDAHGSGAEPFCVLALPISLEVFSAHACLNFSSSGSLLWLFWVAVLLFSFISRFVLGEGVRNILLLCCHLVSPLMKTPQISWGFRCIELYFEYIPVSRPFHEDEKVKQNNLWTPTNIHMYLLKSLSGANNLQVIYSGCLKADKGLSKRIILKPHIFECL